MGVLRLIRQRKVLRLLVRGPADAGNMHVTGHAVVIDADHKVGKRFEQPDIREADGRVLPPWPVVSDGFSLRCHGSESGPLLVRL